MAFAQLTFRESLRSQAEKLYHMGTRGQVLRNTLANANATRDWRICAYALDSTIIDLPLSLDADILDQLVPEAGAFCVMDRGHIDFLRLHRLHQAGSFFVTRIR
jgi:hypothetical protein